MYSTGKGVRQDHKEAFKWNKLAAEQGVAKAQSNLGADYASGEGVARDYVQAYKWFDIAGANGNEEARRNRDVLKKRMGFKQIAEAQKLVREWVISHKKK